MPELPEVEGVVRELAPTSIGRTISEVHVSDVIRKSKELGKEAIVKGKTLDDFIQELAGMTIVDVTRRSKYIYFHMEKAGQSYLLVSHLGMTGAWFVVDSLEDVTELKFRNHVHVVFKMMDGGLLVYSDIRRFGELRLLQKEEDYEPLLKMAPEPFADNAADHFLAMATMPKYARKPDKRGYYGWPCYFRMWQHLCDRSSFQDEDSSWKSDGADQRKKEAGIIPGNRGLSFKRVSMQEEVPFRITGI